MDFSVSYEINITVKTNNEDIIINDTIERKGEYTDGKIIC